MPEVFPRPFPLHTCHFPILIFPGEIGNEGKAALTTVLGWKRRMLHEPEALEYFSFCSVFLLLEMDFKIDPTRC